MTSLSFEESSFREFTLRVLLAFSRQSVRWLGDGYSEIFAKIDCKL
jgi:hypothetical protein